MNENYITEEQVNGVLYGDAYLRYSDKKQDELSIEYQMEEVKEYCQKNGIIINKWYIDRAKSAKKVAGRDGFYEYIDTVKRGTCSQLFVVWRTNRAFRNSYESHKYRKLLRENNIKLVSATQQIDEDTSSGRLVTNILADIDQYKSEEIADHVTAAMRSLVKHNPAVYTGQFPILGYTTEDWKDGDVMRKVYAINESEAVYVRKIFDDFISGVPLIKIAKWMNDEGMKTRRGKAWSYQTLNWLVKNDFYKGTRRYSTHGDPLVFENGVPAIIDSVTFDRAQKHFKKAPEGAGAKPRAQRNGRVYGLTGKIKCELCGSDMCGKGGSQYRYYICRNSEMAKVCTCNRIGKESLEAYVLRQIREHILNEDMIDELARLTMKQLDRMPTPSADKKTLQKKKDKLLVELAEMYQDKLDKRITQELYTMLSKNKNDELAQIEIDMIAAENAPEIIHEEDIKKFLKELVADADKAVNDINGELMKAIFDQAVESIVVNNESVKVTLSLSLKRFSHNIMLGSPIYSLCKKEEREVIKPKRVPYKDWKRS